MLLKTKAECSLQLLGTALRRYSIETVAKLWNDSIHGLTGKATQEAFQRDFRVEKGMKILEMPESCIRGRSGSS